MPLPMGTAPPKPQKGEAILERRERRADLKAHERKEMDAARRRDRGCRWPGCDCKRLHLTIHVCHRIHRGAGGDPSGERTQRKLLISLCAIKHAQWDGGLIDVRPVDEAEGFNGPAEFYIRGESGAFELFQVERVIGQSVMRDGR